MSKQSDGRAAIARSLAEAFESVENSGNVVVHCLTVAAKHYGAQAIPGKDLKFITDSVAVIRNWSEESAKVRKSECRAILSQHVALPDAITLYKSKSPTCDWRASLALARNLRKEKGNVKRAVTAVLESQKPRGKVKLTQKQAKGRATAALNLIMGLPHVGAPLKADVLKLARKFGFTLNVDRKEEKETE